MALRKASNGKFRDECLSLEWFRSRAEAKVIIEAWRRHYNEVRPHSSLDYLTPNESVAQAARPAPRNATGWGAAADGASAPRPVAEPSPRGQLDGRAAALKLIFSPDGVLEGSDDFASVPFAGR